MGKKLEVKSGDRYWRLTILEEVTSYIYSSGYKERMVKCRCDCGNPTIVRLKDLRSGKTQSCGCLQFKTNKYDLSGEYGIGYTSNTNEPFYFDLEDYDKIKDYCWIVKNNYYVESHLPYSNACILLHRLVMNEENEGIIIDHINHKTNDNRKENLRKVDHLKNMQNRKTPTNNTSGYKGVFKNGNGWRAELTLDGCIYGKTFKDKNDAIIYRDELENKYYGEYSYKNSVKEVI